MPEYVSPIEAAERLEVDRRSVYRWVREGRLRAAKVGGRWRIATEDLDRFVLPTTPTQTLGDPVAHFDENVRDFSRWTKALADAAHLAATVAGESDLRRLVVIEEAAGQLLDALDDWRR